MHSGIDVLGALAQRLGRYMAEQRSDGLPGHFGDGLLEAFAVDDPDAIRMALWELEGEGLVELSTLINCRLPRVGVTSLAERTEVSPATVSETLSEMERRDWLKTEGAGPTKVRRLINRDAVLDEWVRQIATQKPPKMRRYWRAARP